MERAYVKVVFVLGIVATACGGGVSSTSLSPVGSGVSPTAGGSGTSGDPATGGDPGTIGGPLTSGGPPGCSPTTLPADRACVPAVALAGQPITIDVDQSEGCIPCNTTLDACTVAVEGTTVTVAMAATACTTATPSACSASCAIPSTKCTVPALAAGTYEVHIAGEPTHAGLVPRQLVVSANATATATSCTLERGAPLPPPMDPSGYSRSCTTDEDCVLVPTGNLCAECSCDMDAIAKSAKDGYEADARVRRSQCATPAQGGICSACLPVKATCTGAGTCIASPTR